MNEDAEMYDPKEAFFDANYKLEDAGHCLTLEEVGLLCAESDTFTKQEQYAFQSALKALLDQVQQLGMSRKLFLFELHEASEPESELGHGGIFGDDDEVSTRR
jgi:hypothetical protein